MSRTRSRRLPARDSYLELVKEFPLVSIQSEKQLAEAQRVVDRLLSKADLDPGTEEYLDTLGDLIALYEDSHIKFRSVGIADLLLHLMEAKGVKQSDVADGTRIPRSTICALLAGKRRIRLGHIGPLARYFHVPPSVLLTEDAIARE